VRSLLKSRVRLPNLPLDLPHRHRKGPARGALKKWVSFLEWWFFLADPFFAEAGSSTTPSVSLSLPPSIILVPRLSKKIHFADATTDSKATVPAAPPINPVDPLLVDPASGFTGTLQLVPSFQIPSVFPQSGNQRDVAPPHAAFRTLFTARAAAIHQRGEWDATRDTAMLALQQAETGRALAADTEQFLTREMVRLLQAVQGQVSMVKIDQYAPDVEAEWASEWNRMATTLPPNLENSGPEYSEEGYVEVLGSDNNESEMESKE
jgi:hypothetical protein